MAVQLPAGADAGIAGGVGERQTLMALIIGLFSSDNQDVKVDHAARVQYATKATHWNLWGGKPATTDLADILAGPTGSERFSGRASSID